MDLDSHDPFCPQCGECCADMHLACPNCQHCENLHHWNGVYCQFTLTTPRGSSLFCPCLLNRDQVHAAGIYLFPEDEE